MAALPQMKNGPVGELHPTHRCQPASSDFCARIARLALASSNTSEASGSTGMSVFQYCGARALSLAAPIVVPCPPDERHTAAQRHAATRALDDTAGQHVLTCRHNHLGRSHGALSSDHPFRLGASLYRRHVTLTVISKTSASNQNLH